MFTLVYTGKAKHILKLCLESDSLLQEIMLLKLMSECYFEITIQWVQENTVYFGDVKFSNVSGGKIV